jgi:uncharacterized protein YjiK
MILISRAAKVLIALAAVGLAAAAMAEEREPPRAGTLEAYTFSAESSHQWKLPDKLNEISGLALSDDQRLFAVTDETAIVYELDYADGRLVKAFALGNPVIRGDFEGIAWFDGRLWLVTSQGRIYAFDEGEDGERVPFDSFDTGLGNSCEIEGLAYRRDDQVLLVLCKGIKRDSGLTGLAIFAWSTIGHALMDEKTIALPDRDIVTALRTDRLNPSGIAIEEKTGNLLIVAARQRAIIELDAGGGFLSARVLPLASRHRQVEGIEILQSGDLLIADEGGAHKGRLAIYRPDNLRVTDIDE